MQRLKGIRLIATSANGTETSCRPVFATYPLRSSAIRPSAAGSLPVSGRHERRTGSAAPRALEGPDLRGPCQMKAFHDISVVARETASIPPAVIPGAFSYGQRL